MAKAAPHNTATAAGSDKRSTRPMRVGTVTSAKRDKTIRVEVGFMVRHPKYGKYLRRQIVLHAHDEQNECNNGDTVEIAECRPISKTKSWRLVRVLKKAPQEVGVTA